MSFKQKNVNNSGNNNTINNIDNSEKTNITNISTNVNVVNGDNSGKVSNELPQYFISFVLTFLIYYKKGLDSFFKYLHQHGFLLYIILGALGIVATILIYFYSKKSIKATIYIAFQMVLTPLIILYFFMEIRLPDSVTAFLKQMGNGVSLFDSNFSIGSKLYPFIFTAIFFYFLTMFLRNFYWASYKKLMLNTRGYILSFLIIFIFLIFGEHIPNF